MTARLTTLCGCQRFIRIERPAPTEYRLPLLADWGAVEWGSSEPCDWKAFNSIKYRTFKLVSLAPSDAAVDADYIEVAE